ncbi:MAG: tryptophanase, partial [Prevotella sp.]
MELPFAESWKIKMVEPIHKSTRQQREQWLKEAHYNVFQLRSEQVYIDLLTDSGTGAMSDRQWAELMLGDESYAGATSFYKFESAVQRIFGFKHVIPTHQGRAAENVLFSYLVKPGMVVPGNAHFDTTKGHIESRKAKAIDVTIDEAHDTQLEIPFKGNVSLEKLEKVLKENKGNVPFMVLTVTNNTVGGQPVSMENIKATCKLCHQYGVPVVMDSARFAENAYFIKTREKGYADKTIKEIVREMYEDVDAATMSCKKDAIVNMGGFIATSRDDWYEGAKLYCIPFEGYITYGGLNGRDLNAIAQGLDENTEFNMLQTRIHQVQYLASLLDEYGIPYQRPAGGHAIFVDGDKVLDRVPKEEFPA